MDRHLERQPLEAQLVEQVIVDELGRLEQREPPVEGLAHPLQARAGVAQHRDGAVLALLEERPPEEILALVLMP